MKQKILMGIDGGGTYTRVIISTENGKILSQIKHEGGANFHKNPNAINDVHQAIQKALNHTTLHLEDIDIVVAGIAGYDQESDLIWVNELTNLEGLKAKKINVNDAKIAHAGALLGQEGIICIAGTGSIILGLNEDHRYIRNYDFYHNAYAASRLLTYQLVHLVLAHRMDDTDTLLVQKLLHHFHCASLNDLALLGANGFEKDTPTRDKHFGDFAIHITQAASQGSHLAMEVCDDVSKKIVTGIELVGSTFKKEMIPVALIGSVANDTYIKNRICRQLAHSKYQLKETRLSPEKGAIILGMQDLNIPMTVQTIENLKNA